MGHTPGRVRPRDRVAAGDTVLLDDLHPAAVGYMPAAGHRFKSNCRTDYKEHRANCSSAESYRRSREAAPAAAPDLPRWRDMP